MHPADEVRLTQNKFQEGFDRTGVDQENFLEFSGFLKPEILNKNFPPPTPNRNLVARFIAARFFYVFRCLDGHLLDMSRRCPSRLF